ncbi:MULTISPECIES: SAM-dependent methyltransferase [unclassified Nonomuraea]|uniref:SAM-dependent methyltransferase n=1 Tax=unclassified Nonomuraea TaxID=2593643 RepID=UPI0033EF666F
MAGIDTSVPHSARIWNYWLGGKDNYEVDRIAGDEFLKIFPGMREGARESRAFLRRTIAYLTAEAGIRQFLDIGTGLPTADNTHEIAQGLAPESRVVYVDNDPLVLAHARALLIGTPEGATDYIDADVRDPGVILRAAGKTLDLGRPVALNLSGIMGHVTDDESALAIVGELLDALPAGSYLALNDGTNVHSQANRDAHDRYNDSGALPYVQRSPEQIARFFDGLELVEPGLVSVSRWRPATAGVPDEVEGYGAVGRKP